MIKWDIGTFLRMYKHICALDSVKIFANNLILFAIIKNTSLRKYKHTYYLCCFSHFSSENWSVVELPPQKHLKVWAEREIWADHKELTVRFIQTHTHTHLLNKLIKKNFFIHLSSFLLIRNYRRAIGDISPATIFCHIPLSLYPE